MGRKGDGKRVKWLGTNGIDNSNAKGDTTHHIKVSPFNKASKSSSTILTSPLEGSPIFNPMHRAKGREETSMVKALTLVPIGVLEMNGATNGKEVKGESNTSSRSVKGASSTKLNVRGRKDSKSL